MLTAFDIAKEVRVMGYSWVTSLVVYFWWTTVEKNCGQRCATLNPFFFTSVDQRRLCLHPCWLVGLSLSLIKGETLNAIHWISWILRHEAVYLQMFQVTSLPRLFNVLQIRRKVCALPVLLVAHVFMTMFQSFWLMHIFSSSISYRHLDEPADAYEIMIFRSQLSMPWSLYITLAIILTV